MLLPLLRSSSYRPSLAKTKREKSRDEQKLLGTKGNRERERERERKACCLPLPKLHKSVDRILIRRQLTSDTYTCKPQIRTWVPPGPVSYKTRWVISSRCNFKKYVFFFITHRLIWSFESALGVRVSPLGTQERDHRARHSARHVILMVRHNSKDQTGLETKLKATESSSSFPARVLVHFYLLPLLALLFYHSSFFTFGQFCFHLVFRLQHPNSETFRTRFLLFLPTQLFAGGQLASQLQLLCLLPLHNENETQAGQLAGWLRPCCYVASQPASRLTIVI